MNETNDIQVTAQSVLPVLRILQPNDSYLNDNEIVIRIERDSDGFIFDANNADPIKRVFKLDSQCENPWIPLKKGENASSGRLQALVSLDPKVFTDGDYVVNFHDARFPAKAIFGMDSIYIYGGKAATPRPFQDWEIATRMMQAKMAAHKIAGSFGAMINDMNTRLIRVEQKLDQLLAKHP